MKSKMVDAPDDAVVDRARRLYTTLRNQSHAPACAQGSAVALLNHCEQFYFGEDRGLVGWTVGEGPLVCLVHGWGGRGAQMAPLAMALAGHGFRAAFFDPTADIHGGFAASRIRTLIHAPGTRRLPNPFTRPQRRMTETCLACGPPVAARLNSSGAEASVRPRGEAIAPF